MEQSDDLAVVIDQKAGEMLHMAAGIDLDPVGMVDQRAGGSGGSEKRCGEREDGPGHAPPLSIVRRAVKS